MESIIINTIEKSKNRVDIRFQVSNELNKFFLPDKHFFVEYNCDISDVPESVLVVPLLLNLLPFSWLTNSIIWIDEIDKTFYEVIPALKSAFRELYPKFNFGGTLIAARLIEKKYVPERKVLQLFTGGTDATTTFYRIQDKKPVLFNVNGWYENDICEDSVYNADKRAFEAFAKNNNVDLCVARSNFARFIRAEVVNREFGKKVKNTWWFGFQHSMAFLGCAVVAGYHYKVKDVYIASSYTFGEQVVCVSDPSTDNCIKCASMETVHDGYELSRQGKIKFLVNKQRMLQKDIPLRVCSFNKENCCTCEKCCRTMLAIVAENGKIERFGFSIPGTLMETIQQFLQTQIMELNDDHIVFWKRIISRMEENYNDIQEKELCDYLKRFPFEKEKKKFLFHYYRCNFWSIVIRKLHLQKK